MRMLGQDDLFTKAMIDSSLNNMDEHFTRLIAQGLPDEARAYLRLLATRPDVCAWLSFTSPDGVHTSHGEPLAECARLIDGVPNVIAVGVNCVRPEVVGDAIRALKSGADKPIVVYPNSGERWDAGGESWHGVRGSQMIPQLAPGWVQAGARLVGGCCRVGPGEIAALAIALAGREIRPGTDADLPEIRRLLELGGLPTADLDTARPRFVVAIEGAMLVGAAGLEIFGATGLLRSVVVVNARRGAGLGRALIESVESAARQRGLDELVLLTETARYLRIDVLKLVVRAAGLLGDQHPPIGQKRERPGLLQSLDDFHHAERMLVRSEGLRSCG